MALKKKLRDKSRAKARKKYGPGTRVSRIINRTGFPPPTIYTSEQRKLLAYVKRIGDRMNGE